MLISHYVLSPYTPLFFIIFSFYLINNPPYSQGDSNAQWEIRCKRTCPECKICCCNRTAPFPAEYGVAQISAPNRRVHKHYYDYKNNNSTPILTFPPNPFAEIYELVLQFNKKILNFLHFSHIALEQIVIY